MQPIPFANLNFSWLRPGPFASTNQGGNLVNTRIQDLISQRTSLPFEDSANPPSLEEPKAGSPSPDPLSDLLGDTLWRLGGSGSPAPQPDLVRERLLQQFTPATQVPAPAPVTERPLEQTRRSSEAPAPDLASQRLLDQGNQGSAAPAPSDLVSDRSLEQLRQAGETNVDDVLLEDEVQPPAHMSKAPAPDLVAQHVLDQGSAAPAPSDLVSERLLEQLRQAVETNVANFLLQDEVQPPAHISKAPAPGPDSERALELWNQGSAAPAPSDLVSDRLLEQLSHTNEANLAAAPSHFTQPGAAAPAPAMHSKSPAGLPPMPGPSSDTEPSLPELVSWASKQGDFDELSASSASSPLLEGEASEKSAQTLAAAAAPAPSSRQSAVKADGRTQVHTMLFPRGVATTSLGRGAGPAASAADPAPASPVLPSKLQAGSTSRIGTVVRPSRAAGSPFGNSETGSTSRASTAMPPVLVAPPRTWRSGTDDRAKEASRAMVRSHKVAASAPAHIAMPASATASRPAEPVVREAFVSKSPPLNATAATDVPFPSMSFPGDASVYKAARGATSKKQQEESKADDEDPAVTPASLPMFSSLGQESQAESMLRVLERAAGTTTPDRVGRVAPNLASAADGAREDGAAISSPPQTAVGASALAGSSKISSASGAPQKRSASPALAETSRGRGGGVENPSNSSTAKPPALEPPLEQAESPVPSSAADLKSRSTAE